MTRDGLWRIPMACSVDSSKPGLWCALAAGKRQEIQLSLQLPYWCTLHVQAAWLIVTSYDSSVMSHHQYLRLRFSGARTFVSVKLSHFICFKINSRMKTAAIAGQKRCAPLVSKAMNMWDLQYCYHCGDVLVATAKGKKHYSMRMFGRGLENSLMSHDNSFVSQKKFRNYICTITEVWWLHLCFLFDSSPNFTA